jgi:hypothetical protein
VLRYLRELGCPWDAAACNDAAFYSQLEALRYMHEEGCPWDAVRACELAAGSGSLDIIKYTVEKNNLVLTAAQLTNMLNAAGRNGELETAKWLRLQGAQWPTVLMYNSHLDQHAHAWSWRSETVAWAREQGCTSSISHNVSNCLLFMSLAYYYRSHCRQVHMLYITLASILCCKSPVPVLPLAECYLPL